MARFTRPVTAAAAADCWRPSPMSSSTTVWRRAPYRSKRSSRRLESALSARSRPTKIATSARQMPRGSSNDMGGILPGYAVLEETIADPKDPGRDMNASVLDLRHEAGANPGGLNAPHDFSVL